jgi:hypothetical protein
MDRYSDLVWLRIPTAVQRFAPTLARIFADGGYLRAWPRAAAIVPAAAFGVGAVLGGLYGLLTEHALYTASLLAVAVMAPLGAFGAGIGCATWFGFVLADLLITDRAPLPGFDPVLGGGFVHRLLLGYVPLAAAYALLFGLLVLAPLVARSFAARAEAVAERRRTDLATATGAVVYVMVMAALAYAWSQAAPVLVRPLWTFSGSAPEPSAIQPVQGHPLLLAAIVGAAAAGRVVLTALGGSPAEPLAVARRSVFWYIAAEPLQAAAITVLLGGLVVTVPAGFAFFLLILGLLAIRTVVMPMMTAYAHAIRRVPLLVRLGVCVALSYAMAAYAVGPAVGPGTSSTTTLTIAIVGSLVVSMVLLPGVWVWTRSGPRPEQPAESAEHTEYDDTEPGVFYRIWVAAGGAGLVLFAASPAYAESCPGLGGCTLGAGVPTITASIVGLLLVIVTLPEILRA